MQICVPNCGMDTTIAFDEFWTTTMHLPLTSYRCQMLLIIPSTSKFGLNFIKVLLLYTIQQSNISSNSTLSFVASSVNLNGIYRCTSGNDRGVASATYNLTIIAGTCLMFPTSDHASSFSCCYNLYTLRFCNRKRFISCNSIGW